MAGMRMAKPSQADLDALKEYLTKAEKRNARGFPHGWRRVVWGCDLLIENCCDPNLDYLALKPELANLKDDKEALQKEVKILKDELQTILDVFGDKMTEADKKYLQTKIN